MTERRNYALCWYCNSDDGSKLSDPRQNRRYFNDLEGLKDVYSKVAAQFVTLLKYGLVTDPKTFIDSFALTIDKDEYGTLLYENNAVWHVLCRNKYDKQKVDRAEEEAKEAKRKASEDINPSPVKTRSSLALQNAGEACDDNNSSDDEDEPDEPICFICDSKGEKCWGGCHKAATMGIHEKVWNAARLSRNTALLAKLSAGDMVAIDAVYHLRCLARLYRQAAAVVDGTSNYSMRDKLLHQQVFVELLDYMESYRGVRGKCFPWQIYVQCIMRE